MVKYLAAVGGRRRRREEEEGGGGGGGGEREWSVHVKFVIVFVDNVEAGCCSADDGEQTPDQTAEHIQNDEGFTGGKNKNVERAHDHASDVVLLTEAQV
jgi:hypothetical protein